MIMHEILTFCFIGAFIVLLSLLFYVACLLGKSEIERDKKNLEIRKELIQNIERHRKQCSDGFASDEDVVDALANEEIAYKGVENSNGQQI